MNQTAMHRRGAPQSPTSSRRAGKRPDISVSRAMDTRAEWREATVACARDPGVTVLLDGMPRAARVAFGCVVAIRETDTVAVLVTPNRCWIMSVLERSGCQDVALHAGGELTLRAPRVRLEADETLNVQARQAAFNCDQAYVVGRGVQIIATGIKAIGAVLDTVFDSVRHYSKQHQRTTDGVDRTRAQHLELQAEQMMQLRATHTLIDGERLVKARGAQIHLG